VGVVVGALDGIFGRQTGPAWVALLGIVIMPLTFLGFGILGERWKAKEPLIRNPLEVVMLCPAIFIGLTIGIGVGLLGSFAASLVGALVGLMVVVVTYALPIALLRLANRGIILVGALVRRLRTRRE